MAPLMFQLHSLIVDQFWVKVKLVSRSSLHDVVQCALSFMIATCFSASWSVFQDSRTRSRKERFLRFVLRRKPCLFILIIELLLATLLCLACYALLVKNLHISRHISDIRRENALLSEFGAYREYMDCRYYARSLNFDTTKCLEDEDESAYMSRVYVLLSGEDCIKNRTEYVRCNLRQAKSADFAVKHFKQFHPCGGLRGKVINALRTPYTSIYAPSIDVSKYQGRVLRIKDFMVKCPVCFYSSRFQDRTDGDSNVTRCARDLATVRPGWPEIARYCDDEQLHEVADFCKLYKDVMIEILGFF
ncbi:unnamed protein product [Anisakis simplex]|uniref:Uncharacterized protein n=1 Tax=Anisakis simplex TaxID=6269 RepID=A0A0M3IYF3_ANISI|nr:unnamed protein product [Anisakis simplex]